MAWSDVTWVVWSCLPDLSHSLTTVDRCQHQRSSLKNPSLTPCIIHVSFCHVSLPVRTYNSLCLNVVSLTVLNKTAPPGSNPFEDDEDEEDEEETALEQQTVVNHISATKEEIKMLVKRRKKKRSIPSHVQPSCLLCFPIFTTCWVFSPLYFCVFFVSQCPFSVFRWQVFVLICMVTGLSVHTDKNTCVSTTLVTVPCLAEHHM